MPVGPDEAPREITPGASRMYVENHHTTEELQHQARDILARWLW